MSEVQNDRSHHRDHKQSRRSRNNRDGQRSMDAGRVSEATSPDTNVVLSAPKAEVRPLDPTPPADKFEVYCVHHLASRLEQEPTQSRTGMTSLRHLAVDRFGGATLFCDCLHRGPHEWPPSLQKLQTAVELDQFLTASMSEA